ncbi:MAG: hypothetical protein HY684_04470 [Chloroflexi bacterium]|nr:hypothetical protein [Chloroflexota bacterium]
MKTLYVVTILALLLGLLVGATATAYAAPAEQATTLHGYFGAVASIDGKVITLDTKAQGSVKITVNDKTVLQVPGKDAAVLADIAKGDRIAVLAQEQAGVQTALRVMALPDKPVTAHFAGVIAKVEGDKATITDRDGRSIVVTLSGDVSLAQGDVVTLVIHRDAVSGEAIVRAAEKLERVVDRLAKKIEQVDREAKEKGDKEKEREAARLRLLAEVDSSIHVTLLNRERERASEQDRKAIEEVERRVEKDYQSILGLLKVSVALQLNGTIQAIDTAKKTITVKLDEGPAVTVTITDKTDLEGMSLADLKVGQRVRVQYDRETKAALKVSLRALAPARTKGTISAVDTAKMSVAIKPEDGAAVTVTVTQDTIINKNDKEKDSLANLAVGDIVVEAHYSPVSMAASLIVVRSARPADFEGYVNGIDVSGNSLTVLTLGWDTLALKVTAQADVQKNGPKATLADLAIGDRVEGRYDAATMTLVKLQAKSPVALRFQGFVTSVDVANNTMTILSKAGVQLTLRLTAKTAIERDGQRVALKDVQAGDRVAKVYYDASLVAAEMELRSAAREERHDTTSGAVEVKGLISAVSSTSWTVAGRVVQVDSNTLIQGQGQVGLIAEVMAQAQPDGSLKAVRIEVSGVSRGRDMGRTQVSGIVELQGVVDALGTGQLTVGGKTVKTDSQTVVEGTLRVGAVVEVHGAGQPDGSILASRIEVRNLLRTR